MAEVEDPTPPKHPGAREKKREKEIWSTRKGKSVRSLPPLVFVEKGAEGWERISFFLDRNQNLLLLSLSILWSPPPLSSSVVSSFSWWLLSTHSGVPSRAQPLPALPSPPASNLRLASFMLRGRNGGCCVPSLRRLGANIRPGTPKSTLHAFGAKCSSWKIQTFATSCCWVFPPFWFLRYQNLVFHSQPTNPQPKKEEVRPFWSCTPPIYASGSDISSAITPSRTPSRNLPKSRIFLRLRMNNTSAAELSIVIHIFSLLTLFHSISLLLLLSWREAPQTSADEIAP